MRLPVWIVVCAATSTLAAGPVPVQAADPAPSSKVARVLAVVSLFDSPAASYAARELAEFENTPVTATDLSESSWSTAEFTARAAEALAQIEYDVFLPAGATAVAPDLAALLPQSRQFLTDLAGGLVCPIRAATFGDTWGAPRSGGRVHVGTDLIAPMGTPVLAVGAGTVLRVDTVDEFVPGVEADLGGVTVTFVTVWGDMFYLGHFQSLEPWVQVGATFEAGEMIGLVGQTGNARQSTPHIHLQWHPLGGAPVNPYPLLAESCR